METRSFALFICNVSIIALFMLLVGFWGVNQAQAAIVTWQGDESALWSVGGNWSNGTGVGASDIATFDGTGNTPCTIDTTVSVSGIDINAGYTNTITQAASLTVGSNDYNQDSGTFQGGSQSIDINGTFTLNSGATFVSTSGTAYFSDTFTIAEGAGANAFQHNNGTVVADMAGANRTWQMDSTNADADEIFYNFQINGTSTYYLTGVNGETLVIAGTLTLTNGQFYTTGAILSAQGPVSVASTWDGGTGTLLISGSGINAVTIESGFSAFNVFTINNANATINLTGSSSTTFSRAVTLQAGTFNGGSADQTFSTAFTISGGTFNATTGIMTFASTWTNSGGSFVHNNGTVKSTINGSTASSWNFNSSETFYNFTIDCNGDSNCGASSYGPYLASGDNLIVDGLLNLVDGSLNYTTSDGGVTAKGNVTVGSGWDSGVTRPVLTFAGTSPQSFDLTGATTLFDANITINGASTVVSLSSDLIMDLGGHDLLIQQGTLDLNGYALTVSAGGTETLIINNTGNLQLQGGETVTADSVSYPQFDVGSTVTYDGAAGPYSMYDWTMTNATLVINGGASSVFTLGATETVNNVTITSGILSLGGNGLTVSTTFSNEGTLRWRGSETLSLPAMDTNSGTVEFTGDGDALADTYTVTTLSSTYYNLKINSTDGATDIFQLGAALDVNNNLTITTGDFDVSADNRAITVGGNWANTGTFTKRSGTVNFDDVSKTTTITGATSFNNFTCTTASKAFVFPASTTTTVAGVFTLTGADASLITLTSSSPATTWLLNVSGSSSVDYVNVTDSDASGGNAITHAVSPARSVDGGNNTNWSFNVAPTVASVTAVQQSHGSVLITFIMDDADNDDTLQALVQYNVGGGNTKATMSETDGDTSATYGDPNVENDNSYQVGNAVAYITSSSGANTVSTIWNAPTDASGVDIANATITVTPYDGTEAGTPASSSNFALDTLAPTVSSASYKDTDADGTVDRVDIVFDENITVTSYNTSDWSFSEVGSINLNDTGASASTATILLTVSADSKETGGATDPTVLYTNNANRLTDAYGNAVATFGAPQTVTDGAAPQIKTAAYQDVDLDGKIDTVSIDFTETLNAASVLAHDNITFSNVGDFTDAAFGSATVDLVGAVATVDITLGTEASVIDTAEGSGTIAITTADGNAAFSLTDGTNENTTPKAETQITFLDEAKPIFTSSTSADINADGTVDRITVAFSETVDITDTNAAADGFDGITFSDSCTISNQDLTSNSVSSKAITVTGCTSGDTSITVDPTYVLAGTDMDIDDEASIPNEMTNGETVTGTDGASPVILSAVYLDSDVNGAIDTIRTTWSENVIQDADVATTDYVINGGDINATFSSTAQDLGGDATIDITITADAEETGVNGGTEPTILYVAGQQDPIHDQAVSPNNGVARGAGALTITDQAAPHISTLEIKDSGTADGLINEIVITFSENVDTDDGEAPVIADFGTITLPDGQTVTAATITDPAGASTIVTLTAIADQVTENTATGSTAIAGITTEWTDGTNQTANPDTGVVIVDSAAPHISTVVFEDTTTANGLIDKLTITFSENVDTNDGVAPILADFGTITLPDGQTASSATISDPAGSSAVVILTSIVGQTTENTATGSIAISGITTEWEDANALETTDPDTGIVFTDQAAPFMTQIGYRDSDNDGQIDSAVATFSESSTIVYDDGDWVTVANSLTGIDVSAIASGNGTASITFTATATAGITGGSTQPTIAFTPTTGSIQDTAENATAAFAATSFVDQAKPVINTSTPTDASTAQSRVNSVVYTFSEPMVGDTWVEGTEFDSTPDGSGWSGTWSGTGNLTMTLAHASFLCAQSYSIAFTPAQITATGGESGYTELNNASTAPIGATHTFTTMTCAQPTTTTGSQYVSPMSSPVTDEVVANTPVAESSESCSGLNAGSKVSLAWTVTSSVGFVNLYYSTDSGQTYTNIVNATKNTGSYSWTIPSNLAQGSSIQFKIEGTDLSTVTSTYETSPMNVCAGDEDVDDVADEEAVDDSDTQDESSSEQDQEPDTVVPIGMALETVLGQKWEKDAAKKGVDTSTFPTGEVAIGALVKLPDDGNPDTQADSAVYYIGSDHRRHPFPNEAVYKAWFTTFYGIKTIETDTMSSIPMGPMVTYRPGSTLVKFPSINKVYVVDTDGSLRWIASEELAQALYGDEWSKFVHDISEAFYSSYTFGSTLTSLTDMTWDSVMAVYGR